MIFRSFMRNGAAVPFLIAAVIFLISFNGPFFVPTNLGGLSMDPGQSPSRLGLLLSSLGNVWPLFAACLLYRLDRQWGAGEGPRQ
jgi:hypothetical protein